MAENIMLDRIRLFEKEYSQIIDPVKQVDALNTFCMDYVDSMVYLDICYQKASLAQNILKTIDYTKGIADNLAAFCYYYWAKADHAEVFKYGQEAIAIYKGIGEKVGQTACLTLISYSNISYGNYDEALRLTNEAITLCKDAPASRIKAWAYYSLAVVYFETRDYDAAEKVFDEAMVLTKEIGFTYGIARGLSFYGSVKILRGKYEEALEYISQAIPLYREVGHDIGLSRALNDLGAIYRRFGRYEEAESYLKESYEIRTTVGHKQGIITTAYELGELMISEKKADEALIWLNTALESARKINARTKEFQILKAIASAYKLKGDFEKAYTNLEQFTEIQSAVIGQESAQRIKMIQTRMAVEKSEKEAEIERLKNVELKQAHDIIADKNKEIVDSINYAWMIQSALLASDKLLQDNLRDFFVLFKPKDIVSGDFYWATKKGNRFYLAVCDSTGHGVPGAFMSILNVSYINEAIIDKGITEPNEVFNHTRDRLIENISQKGRQDGMDGILLCIEKSKMTYASAFNSPLLIGKKGRSGLATDKMPVGKGIIEESFNLNRIEAEKGDMLYLYTDGYADQFGGPNGKKFKYKPFEELLESVSKKPLAEQKNILEETFEKWKGQLEQVDDVLIVGIRI